MLIIQRVSNVKGVEHLWEILISRDAIFIEIMKYVPLIIAIIIALVQWTAEMNSKRLKLTLHLPINHFSSISVCLGSSLAGLTIVFLTQIIGLYIYLDNILAVELIEKILLTSIPWFCAGYVGYLIVSLTIIEPVWKYRVAYLIIGLGVEKLFFLSDTPQSYNPIIPILILIIFIFAFLPHNSVRRFCDGIQ